MSQRSYLLGLAACALATTTVLGGLGTAASASTRVRPNATCDPNVCPAGFTYAADEGATLAIVGKAADVAYGADGNYVVHYGVKGTVQCNNDTFGDPAPNVYKHCSTRQHTGTTLSLLQNGNFDGGTGTTSSTEVVSAPGWDGVNGSTIAQYGSDGFPSMTDPGPKVRGANLAAGGPTGADASEESQRVSLAQFRNQIVNGHVTFTISGYFGGYLNQRDTAGVVLEWHDALGNLLHTSKVGFVTPAQRHNLTGLLHRSISGKVPARASYADVHLEFFRYDGTYDDGYADSLSLKLSNI